MMAIAFAGFEAMSASAMMSCASSPVAIGMGLVDAVYLSCATDGTPNALGWFRLRTGTRGSFMLRYRAPTDEDVPRLLLSLKTRLFRRELTPDDVALNTNEAGTRAASARAPLRFP